MSAILLIRHGQAAFGTDNYDNLSQLGVQQARLLGAHLARAGEQLDALYCGPRQRHRDTALHLREGARAAGAAWAEPMEVVAFDEYPFADILRLAMAALPHEVAELRAQLGGADPLREPRSFERLFRRAMYLWIEGRLDGGGTETFAAFVLRVRVGLQQVMAEQGRGRQVGVIASAGTVAAALHMALALSPQTTIEMSWVIANTAVTELRYRGNELGLVTFNTTPHLQKKEWLTYR